MKISQNLLLGMLITICCSIGSAQIIYSNAFNGGTTSLQGVSPTVANTYAGGSSSSTWNYTSAGNGVLANGTLAGTGGDCTLLDFTPQSGYIYSMIASVTLPADMGGQWIAMGFATNNTLGTGGRFVDDGLGRPGGEDWMFVRTGGADAAHQADGFFGGIKTANQISPAGQDAVSTGGSYTFEIDLDTSGTLWTTTAYINGVQWPGTSTFTYATNPPIMAAGIGSSSTDFTGLNWNSWELSAIQVPEPSSLALDGLSAMSVLLLLLRKQKRD